MNQDRFDAMQEAYDSRFPEEYDDCQTQEEIDKETDQEYRYNKLMSDAVDMDSLAADAFIDFLSEIKGGNHEESGELLMFMLSKAADYNGSEAEVPDFVRLVRLAFEWKSKQ